MNIELNEINENYHTAGNFREQTAVLYFLGIEDGSAVFLRSYVAVGTPGSTGFDPNAPGEGSREGWERFYDMVTNDNVKGTFHTHPAGVNAFSGQDIRTQNAFARAFGSRLIWHVVQDVGNDKAQVICLSCVNRLVIRHNLGEIESNPFEKILRLPLPVSIKHNNGVVEIPYV